MVIALAYLHRYGWAIGTLILYCVFDKSYLPGISFILFGLWTLVGYRLRWKHIYCSFQDIHHHRMTPDRVRWEKLSEREVSGLSLLFIVFGVLFTIAMFFLRK